MCALVLFGVYHFVLKNKLTTENPSSYSHIVFCYISRQLIAVPKGPDVLYAIDFLYIQVGVTGTMCLIFIPKVSKPYAWTFTVTSYDISVKNHRNFYSLFNSLFRLTIKKYQNSTWPIDSSHKGPAMRKGFRCHNVSWLLQPRALSRIDSVFKAFFTYDYSISQEICTRFLLCCALLWLYIEWFFHIHPAYFTGTVAI